MSKWMRRSAPFGDRPPAAASGPSGGSTIDEIIDAMLAKRERDREEWARKRLKKVGRKVRLVPKGIR